jgi:hypothetical protein
MLLETEVRPVGKLTGIGINSQHVHIQVLDGFLVPGTIEMTPDIDACGLGGHEQPLFQNLTNSEKRGPRSASEKEPEIAAAWNFPGGWEDSNLPGVGKTSAS